MYVHRNIQTRRSRPNLERKIMMGKPVLASPGVGHDSSCDLTVKERILGGSDDAQDYYYFMSPRDFSRTQHPPHGPGLALPCLIRSP